MLTYRGHLYVAALKRADKVAVSAFLTHDAAEGKTLATDGSRLWMVGDDGADVAWWDDGRIYTLTEFNSRTEKAAVAFVRDNAPADQLAE